MQSSEADPVLAEIANSVMTITLNRPDRGNGWTPMVADRYFELMELAARSPEVRVIVLTGSGSAFCVGGDSEKVQQNSAEATIQRTSKRNYWFPLRIGKPIIAAINGACFGIGLQQALCCDIRIASADAKFSTAYARRGLVAERGMSWLLPRLVGTGHAMDMLLSARLIRAEEAERIGLVNRVVPAENLLDESLSYARQLAERCSPRSMRAMKLQCYLDLMATLSESYERSEEMLDTAVKEGDFKEGIQSWQEKRPPMFPPLPAELALMDFSEKR